jgi:hypothetical protein
MGVGNRQQAIRAIRAMRGQMCSPGRPPVARREDRVRFWEAIARGVSSENAAIETGVSTARSAISPRSSTRGAARARPARKLKWHNQRVRRDGAIPKVNGRNG